MAAINTYNSQGFQGGVVIKKILLERIILNNLQKNDKLCNESIFIFFHIIIKRFVIAC